MDAAEVKDMLDVAGHIKVGVAGTECEICISQRTCAGVS